MKNSSRLSHLALSALGPDRPGLISELTTAILEAGCSFADSRMTVLGKEFALFVLVAGPWNAIAKLENQIGSLQDKMRISITARRTDPRVTGGDLLPYSVEVVTIDRPGVVQRLVKFFATRSVNIEEMSTTRYSAARTGSNMFGVELLVAVPANTHISQLREEFMIFCDELNLDAILEPARN